jgi:hypothetical protein
MAIIVKFTQAQLAEAQRLAAAVRDNKPSVKAYPNMDREEYVALASKLAAAAPGFVELTLKEAALLVSEFEKLVVITEMVAEGSAPVGVDDAMEAMCIQQQNIASYRNIIAKIEAASAGA